MKRLFSIILFWAGLAAIYLLIVYTFTQPVIVKQYPYLHNFLFERHVQLGPGYNARRFIDSEKARGVDILFLGTSRASRGFDPRIFKEWGLNTFTIGTSSQTPLNTYYPLMQPKMLVYDLYPVVFESEDGLESFWDILFSSPLRKELMQMALATGSP